MIFTWAVGTPLAGKQYLLHGTLAAGPFQRTGQGLATAIEKEVGFGTGTVALANVTTTSGDVVVGGQTLGTLSDGFPDEPSNNRVSRHFRYLMQLWSGADLQTSVLFVVLMVTRFVRWKWSGLTKAQWTGLVGACWDASSNANVDGE